jgi:hypothetical protein
MSVLSLYIPIIDAETSEQYIIKMFQDHNIGKVMRVDFVKNTVKNRREAFLHFDEWFDNDTSKALREDILDPTTKSRLVYTGAKFWPLLVNKNAHSRVPNPNYEVLKTEEVKSAFKTHVLNPFVFYEQKPIQTNVSKIAKRNVDVVDPFGSSDC